MSGKNRPEEYIYLAYLTEPREVGESTKRSPQHLTLVPPFPFERDILPAVKEAVRKASADTSAFELNVYKEAKFGPSRKIDVRLVQPVDVVRMLHFRLMADLQAAGIHVPSKFVYDEFVPHITVKPAHSNNLDIGQALSVDHIAIMHKSRGHRTLLAREKLADG